MSGGEGGCGRMKHQVKWNKLGGQNKRGDGKFRWNKKKRAICKRDPILTNG